MYLPLGHKKRPDMQKITCEYFLSVLLCVSVNNVPYGASSVINAPSSDSAMKVVLKCFVASGAPTPLPSFHCGLGRVCGVHACGAGMPKRPVVTGVGMPRHLPLLGWGRAAAVRALLSTSLELERQLWCFNDASESPLQQYQDANSGTPRVVRQTKQKQTKTTAKSTRATTAKHGAAVVRFQVIDVLFGTHIGVSIM